MAANIYIILIQVPGSGAYNIFHPLLFQKALDVLRLWPCKGLRVFNKKLSRWENLRSRRSIEEIDGRQAKITEISVEKKRKRGNEATAGGRKAKTRRGKARS
ncbi:uncharacterized protein LOC141877394 isoform X3 [Acropora palmata]|uniref:uncharacterized protein LOC141877394 isoform X3 n=1 Tax=Acropora palmata TaxID=6131 RepID=UPI003DA197B2